MEAIVDTVDTELPAFNMDEAPLINTRAGTVIDSPTEEITHHLFPELDHRPNSTLVFINLDTPSNTDTENDTAHKRRNNEDARLLRYGWKRVEREDKNKKHNKRPRYLYHSPTGQVETSLRDAMATIRSDSSDNTTTIADDDYYILEKDEILCEDTGLVSSVSSEEVVLAAF